jgi:hypothetical protein
MLSKENMETFVAGERSLRLTGVDFIQAGSYRSFW